MQKILLLLLSICSGCTSTGQRYTETSVVYSEPDAQDSQYVLREDITEIRNRTLTPPFGSKADSQHQFNVTVTEDGSYTLGMGSQGHLEGGQLDTLIQALSTSIVELTQLVRELKIWLPVFPPPVPP